MKDPYTDPATGVLRNHGRSQRAFFGQLSRDAGWPINWSGLDREENIAASVASLRGDNTPLRTLLDALVPSDG